MSCFFFQAEDGVRDKYNRAGRVEMPVLRGGVEFQARFTSRRCKMIRNPYVAGYFYPAAAAELRAAVARCVDKDAPKEEVVGLLVPHAGYEYSGAVAGATISRVKFKDTFIIMGPTHSGLGEPFSVMVEGTWKMPRGAVEIDTELARKITAVSRYLKEDTEAHISEHAVEVQLPFLQYFKPDVRIVPIILSDAPLKDLEEMGRDIARAIKELGREVG